MNPSAPPPFTREELSGASAHLALAALDHTAHILIPGATLTPDGVQAVCAYLRTMFGDQLVDYFTEVAVTIVGRQLTNPVPPYRYFIPCQEDFVAGCHLLCQDNNITTWAYYLLPLTVFGIIYYLRFPLAFPPERCPEVFYHGCEAAENQDSAYHSIRTTHTFWAMQIRFTILRREMLQMEADGEDWDPQPVGPQEWRMEGEA
jgi:hypothetical protein